VSVDRLNDSLFRTTALVKDGPQGRRFAVAEGDP
jgi:hypothetical protein